MGEGRGRRSRCAIFEGFLLLKSKNPSPQEPVVWGSEVGGDLMETELSFLLFVCFPVCVQWVGHGVGCMGVCK